MPIRTMCFRHRRIQFLLLLTSCIVWRDSSVVVGSASQSINGNHLNHEYEQYPSVFSRPVEMSLTAYSIAALRASCCTLGDSSAAASCALLLCERPSRPAAPYRRSAGNPLVLACTSASPRLLPVVATACKNP